MSKTFALVTAFIFTAFFTVNLYSSYLTIDTKELIFSLDSRTGRFYIENPAASSRELQYLLFKDNPPSSYPILILNGQPYRLSDRNVKTKQTFTRDNNRIYGVFSIQDVDFEISYTLTNSPASDGGDTVLCIVSIKNNTQLDIRAGVRFLFDTVYNERRDEPRIYLSSTRRVDNELLIPQQTLTDFVFCGEYDAFTRQFKQGLFIYPYVNNYRAHSIIIGNWRKLDETELDYDVSPRDRFRYNRFGVQDAAVAVFFRGVPIKPNEIVNIGAVLSKNHFEFSDFLTKPVVVVPTLDKKEDTEKPEEKIKVTNDVKVVETAKPDRPETTKPKEDKTEPVKADKLPIETILTQVFYTTNGKVDYDMMKRQQEMALLKTQIDALDRLVQLIERIDTFMTNPEAVRHTIITQKTEPVTTEPEKTKVEPATEEAKTEETKKEYSKIRDIPEYIPSKELPSADREDVKEVMDKTISEYEKRFAEQKAHYERLIREQDEGFKKIYDEYDEKLSGVKEIRGRSERIKKLDTTIDELNQKIRLIEQLKGLRLDFSSMPDGRISQIKEEIDMIEMQLLRLSIKSGDK
jgi:hypothetical protein